MINGDSRATATWAADVTFKNRTSEHEGEVDNSFAMQFSVDSLNRAIKSMGDQSKNDTQPKPTDNLQELLSEFDQYLDEEGEPIFNRPEKRSQVLGAYVDSSDTSLYESSYEGMDQSTKSFVKPNLHHTLQNRQIRDMKNLAADVRRAVYTKMVDDSRTILNEYHDKQTKVLEQFISKFPRTTTTLTDAIMEQMCSLVYTDSLQIKLDSVKSRLNAELDQQSHFSNVKKDLLSRINAEITKAKDALKEAEKQTNHTRIMTLNQHISELQAQYDIEDSKQYTTSHSSMIALIPAFSRGLTLHQFKINQDFILPQPTDSMINTIRLQHSSVMQYVDHMFDQVFKSKEASQKQLIVNYMVVCEWVSQLYQQTQTEWYEWFVNMIRPQLGIMKQLPQYKTALKETMNQRSLMGMINKLNFAVVQESDFQMVQQPQPSEEEATMLHTAFSGQLDLFFQRMSDDLQLQRQLVPSLSCKLQRVSTAIHFENNFIPDLEGLQQALLDTQQDMYHSSMYMTKQSAKSDKGLFREMNFKTSLDHAANMVNDIALMESVIDCIMFKPGQFRVCYEVFITQCSLTTRQVMIGLNTQHSMFNLQLKQADFLVCSQLDNERDYRYTHTKVFIKSLGIMYDMACVFLSLFTHRFDLTTQAGLQAATLLRLQSDVAEILLRKSITASNSAMVHLLDNSTIHSKITTLHETYKVPYADPVTGVAVNYQIANYVNFSNQTSDIIRIQIFEDFLAQVGVETTVKDSQYYYEFQAKQDTQQVLNRGGLCNGVMQNQYAMYHLRINAMPQVARSQHLSSCIAGNYFSLAEVFYTDNSSTFKIPPQLAKGRKLGTPIQGPLSLQDVIEELYQNQSVSIDSAVANLLSTAQLCQSNMYDWQSKMVGKVKDNETTLGKAKILYTLAMMNMQAGRTNFTRLQLAILLTKQSIKSTQDLDVGLESIQHELNSEVALKYVQQQNMVEQTIRSMNANDDVPLVPDYRQFLDDQFLSLEQKIEKNQSFVEYRSMSEQEWENNRVKAETLRQLLLDAQKRNQTTLDVAGDVDKVIRESIIEVMNVNDTNRQNYIHNIMNQSSRILGLIQDKLNRHEFSGRIRNSLTGQILMDITNRDKTLSEDTNNAIDNIESLYGQGQQVLKKLIEQGVYQLAMFQHMADQQLSKQDVTSMSGGMTQILRLTVLGEVELHQAVLEIFNNRQTPLGDMGRCSTILADLFFRNNYLTTQASLMDTLNQLINVQLKIMPMLLPKQKQQLYQSELVRAPQDVLVSHLFLLSEDNHEISDRVEQTTYLMSHFQRLQQLKVYKKMFNQSRMQMWVGAILASSFGFYLAAAWIAEQTLRVQYNIPNISNLVHQYTALQIQNMHYKALQVMNFFFYKKDDVIGLGSTLDVLSKQRESLIQLLAIDAAIPEVDALGYIGFLNMKFNFGGENWRKQFSYQNFLKRSLTQVSSFLYVNQLENFIYASPYTKNIHIDLLQSQQTNLALLLKKATLYASTLTEISVQQGDQRIVATLRGVLAIEKHFLTHVTSTDFLPFQLRAQFISELTYIQSVLIKDIDRLDQILQLLPGQPEEFIRQLTEVVFTEEERQQKQARYDLLLKLMQKYNPVTEAESQEIEQLTQAFMVNAMEQSFVATSLGYNDMMIVSGKLRRLFQVTDTDFRLYSIDEDIYKPGQKPSKHINFFDYRHLYKVETHPSDNAEDIDRLSFVNRGSRSKFLDESVPHSKRRYFLEETPFRQLSTNKKLLALKQARVVNIGMQSLHEVFGGSQFMQTLIYRSESFIASEIDLDKLDPNLVQLMSQAQNLNAYTVRARLEANVAYHEMVRSKRWVQGDPNKIEPDPEFERRSLAKVGSDSQTDQDVMMIYYSLIDRPMFLESMKAHANVQWLKQAEAEFKTPTVGSYQDGKYSVTRAIHSSLGFVMNNLELTQPAMFGYDNFYGSTKTSSIPQQTVLHSYNNKPYITVNGITYPSSGTFIYNALNAGVQYSSIHDQLTNQTIRMEFTKQVDMTSYNKYATAGLGLIGLGVASGLLMISRRIVRREQEKIRTNRLVNVDAEGILEDHSKYVYHQTMMPDKQELNKPLDLIEMAVRVDSRKRTQVTDLKYAVFNNFVVNLLKGVVQRLAGSLLHLDLSDSRERFYTQNQAQLKNKALGHIFGGIDPMKLYQISQTGSFNIAQHAYRIPSLIVEGLSVYSKEKDVTLYSKSLVKEFSDNLNQDQKNSLSQLLSYGGAGLDYVLDEWSQLWTMSEQVDFDQVYRTSLNSKGLSEPGVYTDWKIIQQKKLEIAAFENEQVQQRQRFLEGRMDQIAREIAARQAAQQAAPQLDEQDIVPAQENARVPDNARQQAEQLALVVQPRNAVMQLDVEDQYIQRVADRLQGEPAIPELQNQLMDDQPKPVAVPQGGQQQLQAELDYDVNMAVGHYTLPEAFGDNLLVGVNVFDQYFSFYPDLLDANNMLQLIQPNRNREQEEVKAIVEEAEQLIQEQQVNEAVEQLEEVKDAVVEIVQDEQPGIDNEIIKDMVSQAIRELAQQAVQKSENTTRLIASSAPPLQSNQLALPQQPVQIQSMDQPMLEQPMNKDSMMFPEEKVQNQPKQIKLPWQSQTPLRSDWFPAQNNPLAKPVNVMENRSVYPQPIVPSKFLEGSHVDVMLDQPMSVQPITMKQIKSKVREQMQEVYNQESAQLDVPPPGLASDVIPIDQEESKEESKEVVEQPMEPPVWLSQMMDASNNTDKTVQEIDRLIRYDYFKGQSKEYIQTLEQLKGKLNAQQAQVVNYYLAKIRDARQDYQTEQEDVKEIAALDVVSEQLQYQKELEEDIRQIGAVDAIREILEQQRVLEQDIVKEYIDTKIKQQEYYENKLEEEIKGHYQLVAPPKQKPVQQARKPREIRDSAKLAEQLQKRRDKRQKNLQREEFMQTWDSYDFESYRDLKVDRVMRSLYRNDEVRPPPKEADKMPGGKIPPVLPRRPLTKEEAKKEGSLLMKDMQADQMMDAMILLAMDSMQSVQQRKQQSQNTQVMRSLVIADRQMQKGSAIRKRAIRKRQQKTLNKMGQPLLSKKLLNDTIKSHLRSVF